MYVPTRRGLLAVAVAIALSAGCEDRERAEPSPSPAPRGVESAFQLPVGIEMNTPDGDYLLAVALSEGVDADQVAPPLSGAIHRAARECPGVLAAAARRGAVTFELRVAEGEATASAGPGASDGADCMVEQLTGASVDVPDTLRFASRVAIRPQDAAGGAR